MQKLLSTLVASGGLILATLSIASAQSSTNSLKPNYSDLSVPPVPYYQPMFPDQQPFGSMRFEKLEWNGPGSNARWDMEAFVGGDYDKFFLKSEGFYDGKTRKLEEGQVQLLYLRLISYYFDAQFGIRQDFSAKSNRTYATIGVEGLVPFFIEIDADLYISQKGEVSAALTAFHDVLITNRLILQPRIDLKLQAQRVSDLNLGSGFTDVELGARLRYEVTRNVAPYIGVVWDRKLGETAGIARANGEAVGSLFVAGGVRVLW